MGPTAVDYEGKTLGGPLINQMAGRRRDPDQPCSVVGSVGGALSFDARNGGRLAQRQGHGASESSRMEVRVIHYEAKAVVG